MRSTLVRGMPIGEYLCAPARVGPSDQRGALRLRELEHREELDARRLSQGGGGGADPTLTVVRVGAGSGTVTSSPPGVNCPPDCTEQSVSARLSETASGDVYVLTAHPAAGSVFTRRAGACSGNGTRTVVLSADTFIAAWFDLAATPSPTPSPSPPPPPTTFDLNVFKVGKGRVMSASEEINCGQACTATYDEGSMVTLTAIPRNGWMLKRWRYGCSGSELVCTLEMSSNRRAEAVFVRVPIA